MVVSSSSVLGEPLGSSIRANMERHCDWIIAVRFGCLVILHTSTLQTNWYHVIPSSGLEHHWSRASILHPWWLPSIQIRIERLVGYKYYRTSAFVGIEMCDFQDLDPHLIYGSLDAPKSTSWTASQSVQPLLHSYDGPTDQPIRPHYICRNTLHLWYGLTTVTSDLILKLS